MKWILIFVSMFLVELPDKTSLATLSLVSRYGLLGDTPITIILIALMIISWIAERFVPGAIAALEVRPGGQILAYALAVIFPGSLLGLVFDGLFVWFGFVRCVATESRGSNRRDF